MKLITAIIEQVSVEGLANALPTAGVESLTISEVQQYQGEEIAVEVYRGVKLPKYFSRQFRVELLVADTEVDRIIDNISLASDTGLIGTSKLWVVDADQVMTIPQVEPALI